MESTTNESIVIQNNSQLSENHEILQGVIRGELLYKKLILKGTENAFEEDFLKSESFEIFWTKLGKTVIELDLYVRPPVNLENYFNRLQRLWIHDDGIFEHISLNLFKQNGELEDLWIKQKLIEFISDKEIWEIDERFIEILKHPKGLKQFQFCCEIPLIDTVLTEIFAELNYSVLGTDEIIFDCDPLPSWTDNENHYWIVTRIMMKFSGKVVIEPLWIKEKFRNDQNDCHENCSLNHKILKSDSVLRVQLEENQRRCLKYYKNCCRSFSYNQQLYGLRFDDALVLEEMSRQWKHLKVCECAYDGPALDSMPPFPKLIELWLIFDISNYKNFERFVKSLATGSPDLEKFYIEIKKGITDDECVEIIAENLRYLQILNVWCDKSKLTPTGLDLISNKLQNLIELEIYCYESSSDIQKLFDKLHKLEVIRVTYTVKGWLREFIRQEYNQMELLSKQNDDMVLRSNDRHINDLPPELLENVFTRLKKNDQLSVRSTCVRWFEICSSSSKLNRTFNLENAYLSLKTNPVKLFTHTKFKYNKIWIHENTNFNQDEDLTKFWEKIGAEIQQLCLLSRDSNFMDAFKTGLKANHFPKSKILTFQFVSLFYDLLLKDVDEWKKMLGCVEILKINNLTEKNIYTELTMSNVTQLQVWGFQVEDLLEFFNRIKLPKIQTFLIFLVQDYEYEAIFRTKIKFTQIKTLFIEKIDDWKEKDFNLIVKKCPNLTMLGLVVSTDRKYDKTLKSTIPTEQRKVMMKQIDRDKILKMMFEKLEFLSGIYFMRKENFGVKSVKSYLRTGVNRFEKSYKSHPLFEVELY